VPPQWLRARLVAPLKLARPAAGLTFDAKENQTGRLRPVRPIKGLHHITAIAGPPRPSLDFHTGLMGRRLVKTTVNFDDPHVYHLYYGSHDAAPGGILTVFPFPRAVRGRNGPGMATGLSYAASGADVGRIGRSVEGAEWFERFGERGLRLHDPDGLVTELIVPGDGGAPLANAPFHSVTLTVDAAEPTLRFLADVFGYVHGGEETDDGGRRIRLRTPSATGFVDVVVPAIPEAAKQGAGSIHHVAFRAADDDELMGWREAVHDAGLTATPMIDRQYFHSIYFRESGGILFEIATDPPGFTVDEPLEHLGEALKLPPQFEPRREEIEQHLPALSG